jgi:hypothetical protein
MMGGLIEPSDIRFLEGVARSGLSVGLSSVPTDEQTEETAVLVAESEEPYRQFPSVSIFQLPFFEAELAELRSNNSVPDEDWLESSSSTRDDRTEFISGLTKSADGPVRDLISTLCAIATLKLLPYCDANGRGVIWLLVVQPSFIGMSRGIEG